MIIIRTKLINYKGEQYVDLRSYEVELHRRKKATARVVVGDEYIDLPPAKLRWGKKITTEVFQMNYPPFETYTLLSYKWEYPKALTKLQYDAVYKRIKQTA